MTMIPQDILNKGIGFRVIYPSILKTKTQQRINIKFSEYQTWHYNHTEYYLFFCTNCDLKTTHGKIQGKQKIAIPIISFNRAINVCDMQKKIKQNWDRNITLYFTKKNEKVYSDVEVDVEGDSYVDVDVDRDVDGDA